MGCRNYLCFFKDLTLATRLIAFFGITLSVLLMTVLINDTSTKNFNVSRNVALALGLDWRHIHPRVNTTLHADPDGKVISALMIFYAILFFATNALLFIASILKKSYFVVPWLIYELVSCLSKVAALIFHVVTELNELNQIFITGSIIYLLVIFWWWLVVYSAQSFWQEDKQSSFELSPSKNTTQIDLNSTLMDSPEPYRSNSLYTEI